jgi:hypothetical protein
MFHVQSSDKSYCSERITWRAFVHGYTLLAWDNVDLLLYFLLFNSCLAIARASSEIVVSGGGEQESLGVDDAHFGRRLQQSCPVSGALKTACGYGTQNGLVPWPYPSSSPLPPKFARLFHMLDCLIPLVKCMRCDSLHAWQSCHGLCSVTASLIFGNAHGSSYSYMSAWKVFNWWMPICFMGVSSPTCNCSPQQVSTRK